jgi:hypothetical protein
MSKTLGLKREIGGERGRSPSWWLRVRAAAEANHATNNMSSQHIIANQPKSGSGSNATSDDLGQNSPRRGPGCLPSRVYY